MRFHPARRMDGIERTLIRRIFDTAPAGAINLGLGQPDLPTPDVAALAGISAITEGQTRYTETAGDLALREAIARAHQPFTGGPDEVLVTVGSQEALFVSCLALVGAGDEILLPDPGYPAYAAVARLLGARPQAYPLRAGRGFRLDPRDVESRLSDRTRAVILCSPSNPTGACSGAAELAALAVLLAERSIPWISDEIYSGFHYGERFASPADSSPEGGLVISGLSKILSMTGWRIGWVLGPRAILSRITAAHQYLVTCAPSISQRAALAAFTPRGTAARQRRREIFRARRELMDRELSRIPGLSYDPPDGAFYFFVDVRRFGDSVDLAKRILERREVITIPGDAFGPAGRGYLRLSFAAAEQDIREGVRRIGRELGGS